MISYLIYQLCDHVKNNIIDTSLTVQWKIVLPGNIYREIWVFVLNRNSFKPPFNCKVVRHDPLDKHNQNKGRDLDPKYNNVQEIRQCTFDKNNSSCNIKEADDPRVIWITPKVADARVELLTLSTVPSEYKQLISHVALRQSTALPMRMSHKAKKKKT